ncbi:hypothetical protein [Modestobacter sp. VKM Ac-2984]|uniref:hypothetical protein n=1 Tax=Modestobacter sp. VKM Ac-2984 TaxID=3004138 RepID=UPI0022AACAB2|nr:hypothetical protein [Modestobacter sp. VKM Ac-2984]MCZ2817895.1 hypothetical protein [Modestobacter sp. VKM Ac-2984]
MSGIIVVDQPTDERVAIWQVSVGDGLESTMAGAWVLPADDERIDGLVRGRLLVTTEPAAGRFGAGADPAALATAIRQEIADLDRAFAGHLASLPSARRSLVRPRWPSVPDAATPEAAGDPLASRALTLARWVSDLLTAWDEVESQRLTRPFLLSSGGETAREHPPGWPAAPGTTQEEAA